MEISYRNYEENPNTTAIRPIHLIKFPSNFSFWCKIDGTLEAPADPSNWNDNNRRIWLVFHKITNLVVTGDGLIDGNGHTWWENSCKTNDTLVLCSSHFNFV